MAHGFEAAVALRTLCLEAAEQDSVGEAENSKEGTASRNVDSKQWFLSLGGTEKEIETALAAVQEGLSRSAGTLQGEANVIYSMASNLGRYWLKKRSSDEKSALKALSCAMRHFHRMHWKHAAWRGANLGGWFLLEPGPASPLFENTEAALSARVGGCEWTLCAALDQSRTHSKAEVLDQHRATQYTSETFQEISRAGLNAVRVPFGYWIVTGPTHDDIYHGPALPDLDRAVELAKAAGLQVLLDLHGCPGGENAMRPCGREHSGWTWQQWRREESVAVLRAVAARYQHADHVTGIQVCNEPSPAIPASVLCDYYESAISAVRDAGMPASRVAVLLPVFTQWRVQELLQLWHARGNLLRFDNIAWDLHLYHDFHPAWSLLSHQQHSEVVVEDARSLALLPGSVVGEWSLARPGSYSEEEVADFGVAQVRAYNHALHGWFFWNWHDHEALDRWDMRRGVMGRGRLPAPLGSLGSELVNEAWEVDAWSQASGRASLLSASSLVSFLGRWVANPLVGLYDGGMKSWLRRLVP